MNRIKGITIEIGGSTVELQAALKDVDKTVYVTSARLRDVNRLLKFDPKNTELLGQKHQLLGQQIENTKERLKHLVEAQKQAAKDPNFDKTSLMDLNREIEATKNNLEKLKKENSKFTQVSQNSNAMGQNFKNVGQSIDGAGKKMSVMSAGIIGLGAAAVSISASFDEQMSRVRAISGATQSEYEALKAKAEEMGASTKFTATESAQALEYMAMAGWDTNEMIEGLPAVLNLAIASGEELGTTSDIVTDALTAFGLEAKDAGHFADVLAAASTKSNTNVAKLGESFKYVAPLMGAMNYSAEDTALALGLMANAGIKSSQAGTSLRQLMTNLAKPTEQVKTAMDQLGISLTDQNGNTKQLKDIMLDLRGAFKGSGLDSLEFVKGLDKLNTQLDSGKLSQEEYAAAVEELAQSTGASSTSINAQYAAALAGQDGLSGLLSIVNASDEDFQKLSDAVTNCNGATQEMADIMGDNVSGDFAELKSQLEAVAKTFGDILVPILSDMMEFMKPIIEFVKELDPEQKKLIVRILAVVAAIGPLLIIIGNMATGIGALLQMFGLIFNPVGLTITVIGALVAALVWLFNTNEDFRKWCLGIRDGVNDLLMQFSYFMRSIPGAVSGAFSDFAKTWNKWLSDIGNRLQNFGSMIWSVITWPVRLIQDAWAGFYSWFANLISTIGKLIDDIKKKFSGVGDFFGGAGDFFGNIGGAIGWNAEGGILTKPTIFGANAGVLQGGGEAGHEAVLPLSKLYAEVDRIVASRVPTLDRVESLLTKIANKDMSFNVDSREMATATAAATDRALQVRQRMGARR